MQSPLRRITHTTEDGINTNPSISGDGRIVAFESTEDIAGMGGSESFRAIRTNVAVDPATALQMGASRAPAPAISQDGSHIAFASKDDPLGTNADHNSEIFLYDGAKLIQVTNTSPDDNRIVNGNFLPSISDDGRFIAFSSNRDLASQNADGNLEIFIYDNVALNNTQLTNSTGIVGFSDAKISGNGASVAYIRDPGTTPSTNRDLLLQNRTGLSPIRLLASNAQALALTFGRAISDDGARVVWSAETATNTSQVFLYDGRNNVTPRITELSSRATDIPLHPTISGDGTKIAFATRRPVSGTGSNSDSSVELYTFDIPSSTFARVTNTTSSDATGYVLSSLNDDGSVIAFNFPRVLSGPVSKDIFANNSEIYLSGTPARPAFGALAILNGASFGHEPSSIKAVAPDSIAVARGRALAFTTEQSQRQSDGTFPTTVGGSTVTVNGRRAQIFFVSPTQVNFLAPSATEIGTAEVIVSNSEGFSSRGTVPTLRAAPGIFTESGDGLGEGMVLNADTLEPGPFDPSSGKLRLIIFSTGVRNAAEITVTAGGRSLSFESVIQSPGMSGLDEVHVLVPADLRGAGTVDLVVRADARDSNPVAVTFVGNSQRDIVINEFLADPPDGVPAGDANHDGVRSAVDDEFIELVNATTHDIDIGGYQLLTRGGGGTSDTLRHTFAAGSILPACTAVVVFGGGAFDSNDPVFGGAQVLKASSGGLSLINTSGVITLRDQAGAIVNLVAYGGSTGLNANAGQSLTRSPDITGNFTLHQSASGSGGRPFSSGTHVDGSSFNVCTSVARIEVSPSSATINEGDKQQFTARAFDANEHELSGVIFFWQSSKTSVATIDQNGLATGMSAGTTEISVSARGVRSSPAMLTVNAVPRVLTRIDVSPNPASIPMGGTQQFTAQGVDQFGNEITDLSFSWESTDTFVATIDFSGLATGLHEGQTTIKASSQGVIGSATLNVTPPTVIFNEALADPPGSTATDVIGDANRDGVRSSSDDEFVEFVNSTSAGINISGWTVRTHSIAGTTETSRHTFAANTTLPAGGAIVVFGGGDVDPAEPVFGCAQVVKASSGGLSLTNSGLTIVLRDASGNFIAQFSYGGTTGLNGGNDQSLTRSPDVTGSFVLHTSANVANGRRFSPGVKVDGTPFGNCPGQLTNVAIAPFSTSVAVGESTHFTAQAFDGYGRPMTGIAITFASDNPDIATIDSVVTDPATGIATATVTGHNQGTAHITASATDGTTTVMSSQAMLSVTAVISRVDVAPASATVNRGNTQQFTATAFDQNNQPVAGTTFTWLSSNPNIATVDTDGFAKGVGSGTVTITASTPDGQGGTAAGTATLTVLVPLVINEVGADVPPDIVSTTAIEGDANRDSVRDSDDDEFLELFNSSSAAVDISGVIVADGTSNRFTFPANTTLASGRAVIIFGGGSPPANDPAFGGALVFTTSSLSLNDTGDTVNVKLSVGGTNVPIATQGYGGASGVTSPSDQSLTRSPDAEVGMPGGGFVAHTTATNAAGRVFSPGTRTDGMPFGSPPISRIELVPASASINIGSAQGFTAHAFSNASGPEIEVLNVSFIWDSSDVTKATVAPNTGQWTTATAIASGGVTIHARAGGQQDMATLTINPTLSISDVSLSEGDAGTTIFTFTVSLSTSAPSGGVNFDITTQDNTATVADNDYVARSLAMQTIPAGTQTYNFDVTINGDLQIEANETFFVNVTNVSGATITDGQGVGTLIDDDSPTLTINDFSQNEGNSGTTTLTFTVSSSLPAPGGGITFDIATQDNTATGANNDYVAKSLSSQSIPAGQQTYTFDVTVNGDILVEANETFFVNVTNVLGATLGDGQGVGTIQNDDAAGLVISQLYGGGGNAGAVYRNDFIEVFNRGTTTVDLAGWSVQYSSAGGTSAWSVTALCPTGSCLLVPGQYFLVHEAQGAGGTTNLPTPDAIGTIAMTATGGKVALVSDTTPLTGACPGDDGIAPFNPAGAGILDLVGYGNSRSTANFCYEGSGPAPAPGNITADVRKAGGCVDTNDNAADFFVNAPSPRNSSSPLNDCGDGRITDITVDNITVTEGTSGTVFATFTVSLLDSSTSTVTVDYATADGTANAPTDYQAIPTSKLTFNPGEVSKTVTVLVNGDTVDEPDEVFFVNLSNPSNAAILDNQGQGTITDDDLPPALTINDVSMNEGNSGTTIFTFIVSLSAPALTGGVNFDIGTQDNTATVSDDDYVARSLNGQTIPAGQQTHTFDVTVNGDMAIESIETFFVNVTNVSGATVTDGQAVGIIQNDDSPTLSIDDVAMAEGDNGTKTFTFTVTSSLAAASGGITFDIATQDNTATVANNDYVAKALNGQTISAGQTSYTFDVTVNGDTLVESNETFFVNMTNVSGATVSDGVGQGTIQNEDIPLLVISQLYGGGGNTGAPFANDFIEIFNRGTTTVNLSGWSVQYISATGTGIWSVTNLSGTILPGRYYLVQEGSGGAVGSILPAPDATGTIAMAATAGKVALLNTTTALSGGCPSSADIVDLVGYGATASCFEGSGPAPAPSNTMADIRAAGGCTDTNNNALNFATGAPTPRNTATAPGPCP